VATGPTQDRTAEQWARDIIAGAPPRIRHALVSGWSAIGLKLDGPVLGWTVRRSSPDAALLAAGSRIGMPGELLIKRRRRGLLFATFVQQDNAIAHAVWSGIEPIHVRYVRRVLENAHERFLRLQPLAEHGTLAGAARFGATPRRCR
jgi:hypothetical protein